MKTWKLGMLTGTLGAMMFLSSVVVPDEAHADKPRVRKVSKNRFKCSWNDGTVTHTVAANRKAARSQCESARPGHALVGVDDEGPVAEKAKAQKMEKAVAPKP